MILLPAIDIRDGKCVRLIQGDYAREHVYSDSPAAMAEKWESAQAPYLHIVDLDGAKAGQAVNKELIAQIAAKVSIPLQVGGGIRSFEQLEAYLNAGVDRVILGTAALADRQFLAKALHVYGDRIAVSVDAKDGLIATDGWTATSRVRALDFIQELAASGVKTVIYTDISKDGMLQGPNIAELEAIQHASAINVIASGGITSEEDVRRLRDMNMYGAIVGKALYDGTTTLKQLLEVC
ncbi:1-(5-phosphoribosyl)-5-[(5-phosphoribosylamino) methylideneamino]imidazole-4-carboxamide isomerase [Barrientosiimonas marina]|uniref:1-(5-phosphoribosyl)-5-[(5-phosphoribosylamino)methylideneamino] imidazole-4-carboxamide isomerase n=1 Tax=Lentibacillus kimchii TaxID=1542911 RepID=A0ABW2UXE9_9BACI